jgi:hypothetical protein
MGKMIEDPTKRIEFLEDFAKQLTSRSTGNQFELNAKYA